jgi:hypothetical protein
VPSKVLATIAELCNKSARRALMLLEQVIYLPESEMINGIQSIVDTEIQSIELCRLMFRKPTPTWKEVSTMLRAMKSANPEDVRNLMLAWMNTALLNGNTRAYVVMTAFTTPYDRTGKAGLSMSCYEALLELSSK